MCEAHLTEFLTDTHQFLVPTGLEDTYKEAESFYAALRISTIVIDRKTGIVIKNRRGARAHV